MADRAVGVGQKSSILTKITKRVRIYFSGFAIFALLLVVQAYVETPYGYWEDLVVAFIFGILTLALGYWSLQFKGSFVLFFKVFTLPFLLVFFVVFTVRQVFFQDFIRFADYLVFFTVSFGVGVLVYVAFLAANILYIGSEREIPLLKVGHTVWYFLTTLVFFLTAYWFFIVLVQTYVVIPFAILMCLLLIVQHLVHFELSAAEVMLKGFGVLLGILTLISFTALWPVGEWLRVFSMTMGAYIGLGYIMHNFKKTFAPRVFWEFFFIISVFVLSLIFAAEWGIFGGLL